MAKFKKIELLDKGGQGAVWKAKVVDTGDIVALKYLAFDPGSSRDDRAKQKQRFVREVNSQRDLEHPGIMPVLACATNSSPPWYAMPLADGSLQKFLDGPKQSVSWVSAVMGEVLAAVEYAHENGVVHRDLKPNNILSIGGKWVVSDFGYCRRLDSNSATITEKNKLVGSVAYAAFEQYDDAHQASPAADIFALTKILIHLLAWQIPYPYSRIGETPEALHGALKKGIAEDPRNRPQTVAEFRSGISELLTSRPGKEKL
ncbi:serine/threonine protein kinase [Kitasatospora sp. NBC_01560]|uniref:serine/threonine-protein kinase n=1 Tax=Kitasatospora sp. NBC_01560 TaxID=2975965 RepID=UPI00386999C3